MTGKELYIKQTTLINMYNKLHNWCKCNDPFGREPRPLSYEDMCLLDQYMGMLKEIVEDMEIELLEVYMV